MRKGIPKSKYIPESKPSRMLSKKKNYDNRNGDFVKPELQRYRPSPSKDAPSKIQESLLSLKKETGYSFDMNFRKSIYGTNDYLIRMSYPDKTKLFLIGVTSNNTNNLFFATKNLDYKKRGFPNYENIFFDILAKNVEQANSYVENKLQFIGNPDKEFVIPTYCIESELCSVQLLNGLLDQIKQRDELHPWLKYFQYCYTRRKDGIFSTNIFKMGTGDDGESKSFANQAKSISEKKEQVDKINDTFDHIGITSSYTFADTNMSFEGLSGQIDARIREDVPSAEETTIEGAVNPERLIRGATVLNGSVSISNLTASTISSLNNRFIDEIMQFDDPFIGLSGSQSQALSERITEYIGDTEIGF